ncbi:hypothetical protein NCCP602_34520 [Brevibacterium metallidurans]|uniref:Uncharacterized protein n=1 Tax=Brevibacterium metallidurans TaxID=1482676 RepID=A0ABP3CC66_9MICO
MNSVTSDDAGWVSFGPGRVSFGRWRFSIGPWRESWAVHGPKSALRPKRAEWAVSSFVDDLFVDQAAIAA